MRHSGDIHPIELIFELVDDGRVEDAIGVLDSILAQDASSARLHALRAFLLVEGNRAADAYTSAQRALEIDAHDPYVQHAFGEAALAVKEPAQAIDAARRAHAMDPENDSYILLEARARTMLGQWDEVRARMDYVLAGNPENESAAILRAYAVEAKRGARGPLGAADWEALAQRFPLSGFLRSGYAWQLLERGGTREAKEEFEQALTIDPTSRWAKQGLVLALKAKYPGYGLLLRYFFWVNTLSPRTRTMIAIGGVVGYNLVRNVARNDPSLRPFLIPLLATYVFFFMTTWLADPLLSLVLMRYPDARRVLSDDDRRSGISVGLCLAAGAVFGLLGLLTPWKAAYLGAVGVAFTSLTVAGAYVCSGKYRRRLLRASTTFLALSAIATVVGGSLGGAFLGIAMLGVAICTWLARSWSEKTEAESNG